jgi:predicted DNA-binding protein
MEVKMSEPITKLRGEHCLNIFVSYQLKKRIQKLAKRYDRPMTDVVRTLIKISIPVMEGLNEAEEKMLKNSISLARKLRKVRQMKIEEEGYQNDQLRSEV